MREFDFDKHFNRTRRMVGVVFFINVVVVITVIGGIGYGIISAMRYFANNGTCITTSVDGKETKRCVR